MSEQVLVGDLNPGDCFIDLDGTERRVIAGNLLPYYHLAVPLHPVPAIVPTDRVVERLPLSKVEEALKEVSDAERNAGRTL